MFIGLIGGAFLLKVWSDFDTIFSYGNSYFILAALIWAVLSKITSQAHRFGSVLGFSFWLNVVTTVALGLVVDYNEVVHIIKTGDSLFWGNMLYFGMFNSSFATTCYLYTTSKIGAEKASSFIFIVSASAAVTSWLLLDEKIWWYTILGGILGVIAVLIMNKKITFKR